MTWLALAKGLVSIVDGLIGYLANKRLLDAGQAEAAAKGLREAHEAIKRAQDARRSVSDDPDSLRDDPNNRD